RKELVVAVKLNAGAKWLSGEEPGYAEQFWFGGAGNLRGYTNDFFRGSRIAWGSLELRRLIGELSSFYAFFDQGYYRRVENGTTIYDYPYSYGIGIRLASRMGVIGLDYGFGEGDTFSTAKIHIRLISRF
ncbi:BamA/TamA family outer membrane protein, partial [bacterium]|nr:BamA/TamA family outer membrane protein [bacterium]